MITEPPSQLKLDLIRRFLKASGIQAEIDTGSLLDRLGAPGTPLFAHLLERRPDIPYGAALAAPAAALRRAYKKHRQAWQDEYEQHLNWEFTEPELEAMVAFLEGATGQHFLRAQWRMTAYIGSNTEHLVEEIVAEARADLTGPDG